MTILPLVGFSSRVKSLSKVDLPAPDVPMMITNSFGSTCKETRSRAVLLRLYTFVTLSSRVMFAPSITESPYACPVVDFRSLLLSQEHRHPGHLAEMQAKAHYWACPKLYSR